MRIVSNFLCDKVCRLIYFFIIITGWTPIHQAAENGHEQVCKLIMDKIKDKNPADLKGRTPLHIAAKNGYLAVCELILDELEDKNNHVNPKVNQFLLHQSTYSFITFLTLTFLTASCFKRYLSSCVTFVFVSTNSRVSF